MRAQPITHHMHRRPAPPPQAMAHRHHGMSPGSVIGAAVAGALIALAFGATSAAAQVVYEDGTYVDEVTVVGPARRDGPTTLSRAVNIRDLDLNTRYGQEALRLRIRATARDLCRELGEGRDFSSAIAPSCVDKAIRDARPQVRVATAQARTNRAYAYLDYPYEYRVYP